MEYIVLAICVLFCGVYFARTQARLKVLEDSIASLSVELARLKAQVEDDNHAEIRDYEAAIQQGVENLMSYGVEVAMGGRK